MSLKAFFTGIETTVEGWFSGLPAAEKQFLADLKPIFTTEVGEFAAEFFPVAEKAVTDLITSGLSNSAKRDAAVKIVEDEAISAGKQAVTGLDDRATRVLRSSGRGRIAGIAPAAPAPAAAPAQAPGTTGT